MAGTTHYVKIDKSKTLAEEPHTGHNRWHEDIPPIVTVDPGDTVVLEARDAWDSQFNKDTTNEDVGANAIEVYIHRLRKKVEHAGVDIRTIRGLGYLIDKQMHD